MKGTSEEEYDSLKALAQNLDSETPEDKWESIPSYPVSEQNKILTIFATQQVTQREREGREGERERRTKRSESVC